MITQRAVNYAKVLYSLGIKEKSIQRTKNILQENGVLIKVLNNPVIGKQEKEAVIDAVFDKEICNYIKVLSKNQDMEAAADIFTVYGKMLLQDRNILTAKLTYAGKPDEQELEQIKAMLCRKFNKAAVSLELIEDTSLIGGYILTVGDTEYDKSIKGTLQELQKTLAGR